MTKIRKRIQEALILELGDTTDSYRYRLSKADVGSYKFSLQYTFETEKGTPYRVNLKDDPLTGFVYTNFEANKDATKTVDEGTMFTVISTVMDIVSDFWRNREEILTVRGFNDIDYLKGLSFNIALNPGYMNRETHQARRFKLYKVFIERRFPSASIRVDGRDVFVTF